MGNLRQRDAEQGPRKAPNRWCDPVAGQQTLLHIFFDKEHARPAIGLTVNSGNS